MYSFVIAVQNNRWRGRFNAIVNGWILNIFRSFLMGGLYVSKKEFDLQVAVSQIPFKCNGILFECNLS